jgi:hypothetical protein
MNDQNLVPMSVVEPAQVWGGLAAEARAGAIRLMANLASNLIARPSESIQQESAPCHHDSPPSRSGPSISIAKP